MGSVSCQQARLANSRRAGSAAPCCTGSRRDSRGLAWFTDGTPHEIGHNHNPYIFGKDGDAGLITERAEDQLNVDIMTHAP